MERRRFIHIGACPAEYKQRRLDTGNNRGFVSFNALDLECIRTPRRRSAILTHDALREPWRSGRISRLFPASHLCFAAMANIDWHGGDRQTGTFARKADRQRLE